jgi:hypothetical protein
MLEKHYSVQHLAEVWAVSTDSIRRLVRKEPGVIIISHRRRGTRLYETLRIPHSVAERIYRRLQNGGA